MSDQADRLVALALELYRVGQSDDRIPFLVEVGGPQVAYRLARGGHLEDRLAAGYYDREEEVPPARAIEDAVAVLKGLARRSEPTAVHLRVAKVEDSIVVDLGDAPGRVVEVDRFGWRLREQSPVLFWRSDLTEELPLPVRGGSIDELAPLVNCDEEQFRLLVGWMVGFLHVDLQQPILAAYGYQGTAKSTLVRMVVGTVDPSSAPLSSPPASVKDWAVHAQARQLIAVDNVTKISPGLADLWCRAVTGEAHVHRQLYTDDSLHQMTFKRAIAFTSIGAPIRGDLADRTLRVDLTRIPDDQRQTHSELLARFEQMRPRLFGALLDMAAETLHYLPQVKPEKLPRMADHARVLQALDLARPGNGYFDAMMRAGERLRIETVEDDEVAAAVVKMVDKDGPWEGTATDLRQRLTPHRPPRGWPQTAQHLSARLRNLAPGLLELGVDVQWERRGAKSIRIITIQPTPDEGPPTSSGSSGSSVSPYENPPSAGATDDADDAYDGVERSPRSEADGESGLSALRTEGESTADLLGRLAAELSMPSGEEE